MFNLFFTINLNKPEPLEFRKCDAKIINNFFDTEELNKEPQKIVNSNLQLELKNYYNSQGLDLNIDKDLFLDFVLISFIFNGL